MTDESFLGRQRMSRKDILISNYTQRLDYRYNGNGFCNCLEKLYRLPTTDAYYLGTYTENQKTEQTFREVYFCHCGEPFPLGLYTPIPTAYHHKVHSLRELESNPILIPCIQ